MKRYYITLLILFSILLSVGFNSEDKDKNTVKAGKKMQEFVIGISNYARKQKNDFIIIPQNGSELAFENSNPDKNLSASYLKAIDGIAIEELFYDEKGKPHLKDGKGISITHSFDFSAIIISDKKVPNTICLTKLS